MPHGDSTKANKKETRAALAADLKRLEEKWELALANKGEANSSNCPKQWRQFINLAKAKKLPAGMSAQYKTSRLDLFNLFLMNNQDCYIYIYICLPVCLPVLPA